MSWLEIKIDSEQDMVEPLENALLAAGAVSVTFEDGADQPLFEPPPGETPLWVRTRVSGLFDADTATEQLVTTITDVLVAEYEKALPPYRFEILEDKVWEREWLDRFKPLSFGKRLWVSPNSYEIPDPEAIIVRLDPGLAFGTGTHPTTALCLEWLDGQNLTGKTVIDYGCGSGILGIAALKLGCEKVIAVDNDPQALIASKENAKNNQIRPSVFETFFPRQLSTMKVDIIIANILASPLIELADYFATLLKPQGKIILSGIMLAQLDELMSVYQQFFIMEKPESKQDWVRLQGYLKK